MQHKEFQYLHNIRWPAKLRLSQQLWRIRNVSQHTWKVSCRRRQYSAVAKNLPKKLTDSEFVYMIRFLLGYPIILKNLSILFQREQPSLTTTELHLKNTTASTESLIFSPWQYKERLITNMSLKGIYQAVQLHGLNSTTRSSESEEKHLNQHAVKYLALRFLHQRNTERSTTVFDTFA
jgi:hypothetical protein